MTAFGACLGGTWQDGRGDILTAVNPASGEVTFTSRSADMTQVDIAVAEARKAFGPWSKRSLQEREAVLHAFAARVKAGRENLASLISQATGKPKWEALQEADLLPAKVKASVAAQQERLAERTMKFDGYLGVVRFKPHGVAGVLGPFNLPAHLPHSHIVPALLAGNAVVFKPSEFAPAVGAWLMQAWMDAGLPSGVLNLVQGGRVTGEALARHPGLDALYFTGSYRGGLALSRLFAETPGKMLALELGGNNPIVYWPDDSGADQIDVQNVEEADAAALIVQSAYLTAGQRCVCARRLILPIGSAGDAVLSRLRMWTENLRIGLPGDEPEPFYGPVIHEKAARDLLAAQADLLSRGAKPLLAMAASPRSPCLLSPGLLDITGLKDLPDEEHFGPLLQVLRVENFDAAIAAANATAFGLSAGLICPDRSRWQTFVHEVRAGVVNWNRQITGASGLLPFGGVGKSGNHRPSAFAAADYCAYPMASLESDALATSSTEATLPPGLVKP
jgi:succinylglutamic semialdehyde dehydrogenase